MRHTLLPLNDRKALRREYYVRALTVFFFVLSLAELVGVVALFPSFVRVVLEQRSAAKSAVGSKDPSGSELKALQQNVVRSQALLDSLNKTANAPKISDLVGEVIALRKNIRLNSFSVNKTGTTTYTMTISGTAPARNDLTSFKSLLELARPDNKVDLPVSELAKSSNIKFSLQLREKINEI